MLLRHPHPESRGTESYKRLGASAHFLSGWGSLGLPSTPSYLSGYNAPYLSVYSENAVDIFDVNSMEWIQTLPLKKVI